MRDDHPTIFLIFPPVFAEFLAIFFTLYQALGAEVLVVTIAILPAYIPYSVGFFIYVEIFLTLNPL